jgi:hypothetical protein
MSGNGRTSTRREVSAVNKSWSGSVSRRSRQHRRGVASPGGGGSAADGEAEAVSLNWGFLNFDELSRSDKAMNGRLVARLGVVAVAAVVSTAGLFGQVQARQGTKEEDHLPGETVKTEVPSPMVVEIGLEKAKLHLRPFDSVWTTRETAQFVCDKASVTQVQILKKHGKKGQVVLEIAPTVATDWMRQDIDLTVAVLGSDGAEVGKRAWDNLTIGNDKYSGLVFGSQSKAPKLELKLSETDLASLYSDGKSPRIKVVVDIQDKDEGE